MMAQSNWTFYYDSVCGFYFFIFINSHTMNKYQIFSFLNNIIICSTNKMINAPHYWPWVSMYHMLMLKEMLKLGEIRFGSQLNGHMDRMILSQGGMNIWLKLHNLMNIRRPWTSLLAQWPNVPRTAVWGCLAVRPGWQVIAQLDIWTITCETERCGSGGCVCVCLYLD